MRYAEEDKLEFNQNTIDDFYESTKAMIDDLCDLICSKVSDELEYGKLYGKTAILEKVCFAIRYVKTFASGNDFQGE